MRLDPKPPQILVLDTEAQFRRTIFVRVVIVSREKELTLPSMRMRDVQMKCREMPVYGES